MEKASGVGKLIASSSSSRELSDPNYSENEFPLIRQVFEQGTAIMDFKDSLPASLHKYYYPGLEKFQMPIKTYGSVRRFFRGVGFFALAPFTFSPARWTKVHEDEVALVTYNDKYYLKGSGKQFVLSWFDKIHGTMKINSPKIQHGPILILRIPDGELGHVTNVNTGMPMLLGPGTHYFDKPYYKVHDNIKFNRIDDNDLDDDQILGFDNYTIVQITTGKVGIVHTCQGGLDVL